MNRREVFSSRAFARDRRTWIATIAAAAVLWAGTSAWLNRRVTLAERLPPGAGDDGRFVALAFDRIVAAPDRTNLDRLRLREMLRSMAAGGWQAITLEDLRAAYGGKAPLPAKPVLVSFDEGYLGTYEAADPVLRELRWPAVMFLRTERQERRDVSFLFWDRLKRMLQSGVWEVATGDPAPSPAGRAEAVVPAEPPGAALIAARLAEREVVAWAPRGTEPVVALSCAEAAERLWRGGGAIPWLGFMDDAVGANHPGGNPFRIARLRVDPRWTPAELLERMELAVADPPGASEHSVAWVAGAGATRTGEGSLVLSGRPRAEAWVPSAMWVDDWALTAQLRLGGGEFWFVQPAETPGREWRAGGSDGVVYVEARAAGRPPEVLARAETGAPSGVPHRLRIVKRGGGVSIEWDGRALTAAPVALPERWRTKLGIVAYRSDGVASLEIEHVAFSAVPYAVRVVASSPSADDVAALAHEATAVAALSPPWASIDGDDVREEAIDRDLFRILARRYAWDIVPTVTVRGASRPGGAAAIWLAGLPDRVRREGYAGVRLDLTAVAPGDAFGWDVSARDLRSALGRVRGRVLVVAP